MIWVPAYNCEMSDEDLLQLANQEKRIFITNDKDFGDLIFFTEEAERRNDFVSSQRSKIPRKNQIDEKASNGVPRSTFESLCCHYEA